MNDIKSNFREWLIKDKKYKASTTKQFTEAINKVCKSFLGRCTDEHWHTLAQNIVPILVYYGECNNHEYYISADETDILEKYFDDQVLRYLRPNTSYIKNIFPNMHLNFIYNAKECYISEVSLNLASTSITAFRFIINQISQNDLKVDDLPNLYTLARLQSVVIDELSVFFDKITAIISDNPEANKSCAYLHLHYTEKPSKQITKALWLFYEYINENDHVLIIDDFLADGEAATGAIRLIRMAHATVAGIGILTEKSFQPGHDKLVAQGFDVYSQARIASMDKKNGVHFVEE